LNRGESRRGGAVVANPLAARAETVAHHTEPSENVVNARAQFSRLTITLVSQEIEMEDAVWVVVTVAFFAVSIAYVRFCDRIK